MKHPVKLTSGHNRLLKESLQQLFGRGFDGDRPKKPTEKKEYFVREALGARAF